MIQLPVLLAIRQQLQSLVFEKLFKLIKLNQCKNEKA